jgi:hypothetical protein
MSPQSQIDVMSLFSMKGSKQLKTTPLAQSGDVKPNHFWTWQRLLTERRCDRCSVTRWIVECSIFPGCFYKNHKTISWAVYKWRRHKYPVTFNWFQSENDISGTSIIITGKQSFLSHSLLWSSGQSFWLQIQRPRVRFPALPDFLRIKELRGLERGPLSLVRTIEELLEWKSSGSGVENRD